MRTLLLLLLSLMTGCEAVSNVKGCRDGWVEFTCNYPEQNGKDNITYSSIDVIKSRKSSKNNEWETTDSVSLYRDTNNKKVRVLIKKLKQEDFAEYQCEEQGSDFDTVKLDKDRVGCKGEFIQTVYRTAKTTITCNYPRDESDVLFFCKENKITCEDILSESSPKSNETFTLTKTNTSFTVSISKVSSHHAGVYWCGVKSNKGSYRAGFRKIQLQVKDIRNFTSSLTIGQNFTYWCEYPFGTPMKKFICKGEDPSICEPLVNTMQLNKNTGRFSMEDDRNKNITITVREVTTDDTGTYWCGAKSTDDKHSNTFFHRFSMIVAQSTTTSTSAKNNAPTPTPTPTSRVSSAQSTTTSTSAENNVQTSRPTTPLPSTPPPTSGVSSAQSTTTSTSAENNERRIITVTVCVGVLLLLVPFVLILFIIYKRFSHSKNTRNAAPTQNIREEAAYAKVQKRPHMPDSGTAEKAIYTNANFPTNRSSASHDDSNAHTYSNVKYTYPLFDRQQPTTH